MEKNVIYKRLIEHRLPLNEISTESAREKSIRHGHISTLHIWWARRPLAASRAAVFATLVPDTEKNFELTKKIAPWESVKDGNNSAIQEAAQEILKSYEGQIPKVMDPFGGGGAIPLEALRLGCETYSLDLNPVAHIIQRSTLEFPQKFGQSGSRKAPNYIINADLNSQNSTNQDKQGGLDFSRSNTTGMWQDSYKRNPLSTDILYWGRRVYEKAIESLKEFYPDERDGKTPVAYLWTRTVRCTNPACRSEVPTIKSWWLAFKSNKRIALKPTMREKQIDLEIVHVDKDEDWADEGLMKRDNVICPFCGNVVDGKTIRSHARIEKMGSRLIAVVLTDPNTSGKSYRVPTAEDIKRFEYAKNVLNDKYSGKDNGISKIPDEEIIEWSGVFNAPLYGLKTWGDVYSPRQMLAILTLIDILKDVEREIRIEVNDEEYTKAIITYLGLNVDRVAMRMSNLCIYDNTTEAIMQVFNQGQSLPMRWSYAEANPIGGASGDWMTSLEYLIRVVDNCSLSSSKSATVLRGTATRIPLENDYLDAIITDPPYYDAVPYSDLSDYFYVLLRRSIGHIYPEHFRTPTTPKAMEATQNIMRHNGDDKKAKEFFENTMYEAFREMHRVLKPSGEATIVFAHKSTDAWDTLISALIKAGFKVEASWPVSTESKNRLRAKDSAALASSTFLNCTKRIQGGIGYFNDVRKQMIESIKPQLKEFWESGIRGADFFMSAIGPGLESYSKYDEVRKMSGEQVLVGEFLDEVRKIVMDFALSQVLGAASTGAVDHATQFAVLALWGYGTELPSDEARKLAQSVGLEISNLGSLIKVSGEKAKMLSIKDREKSSKNLGISEAGSQVPMIDAIHKAVLMLPEGRQKIANYLAGVGYLDQEVFWQTMQAVAEVLEGEADGRSMHELLTIRDNLPKGETAATQGSLGF